MIVSIITKMHIYEPKPSHGWKYEALDATTVEKMAKKHTTRAKLISCVQFCSDPFLFINEIHSVQQLGKDMACGLLTLSRFEVAAWKL